MTVRNHVPLPYRIAIAVAALVAATAGGIALDRYAFDRSAHDATSARLARLIDENKALRADHDRMTESSNTTDSRRVMEGSTIRELGEQIVRLEADNARLKEDVAFFEAATADRQPATAGNAGIAIRRIQVTQDPVTRAARYRVLLTQDAKASRDFTGELQLSIMLMRGAQAVNIVLPENSAPVDASRFAVVFRSYKRIDGVFDLPAGTVLKSVQVRILERGTLRAQQSVNVG